MKTCLVKVLFPKMVKGQKVRKFHSHVSFAKFSVILNLKPKVSIESETICLACPVSGLPQDSNTMMTTGDYTNGESVMLQCTAGYVLDEETTCTCDITGDNPTWNCNPDNAIACVASKSCFWI